MSNDFLLKGVEAGFSTHMNKDIEELQRLQNLTGSEQLNAKSTQTVDQKAQAAEDFESLLLKQMLQSMWQTVPSEGLMSGSKEEEYYRDFLSDAISKHISEHQSIGIKEVIINDMNKYTGDEEK